MSTKWGITALIVGGYLLGLGIAGLNAVSGAGATVIFSLVLVVGFVLTGWSVVLPWDGGEGTARDAHDAPGPVPTH